MTSADPKAAHTEAEPNGEAVARAARERSEQERAATRHPTGRQANLRTSSEPDAGPPVLTDVWQAGDGSDLDATSSNAKVCRNARHFTFDGFAEDDGDIATSWRKLLEREGKSSPDGTSLRDLVLGPTPGD